MTNIVQSSQQKKKKKMMVFYPPSAQAEQTHQAITSTRLWCKLTMNDTIMKQQERSLRQKKL